VKVEVTRTSASLMADLWRLISVRGVEVLPQSIEIGVYEVYASRKHLTPKVRDLIDFLVEGFRYRRWDGHGGAARRPSACTHTG
jgi:DNA-binding transcriptional LysR family regulator